MPTPLNRRSAIMLGAALPMTFGALRAQETPQPIPTSPAPPAPSTINPPVPPPNPPTVPPKPPGTKPVAGAPPVLTPVPAIDKTKSYYLFYDQTIDVVSMRAMRRQLALLVESGVTEITLVIHSPGGFIDPAYAMYNFVRALPARIDTHASGFVMSAACILFLAGERRSADRNARFLFHPAQVPLTGSVTGQQLQDRLNQVETNAEVTAEIYRDRTNLTDTEIASFNKNEVFYTPAEAQSRGIIQTVEDLHLPGDQKARILFLD